jgi:hypothetical protein
MADMSEQEVSDLIESHVFRGYNPPWTSHDGSYSTPGGDWEAEGWDAWAENDGDPVLVQGLGEVSVIESFGGEGQGDGYYMIFRVVFDGGGEQLYKLGGYYASYDGGYYEGPLSEVNAVVREVTFYE